MNLLGWTHTSLAVAALASGAAVLLRRKGTPGHRRLGWVYVGSMVGLNVKALFIYRLFGGFGPFHAAALVSLVTVVGGVLAVRRRPRGWAERHYWWMTYSYVGLLAAGVSEAVTRLPGAVFWWAVLLASAAVFAAGGVLIGRRAGAVLAPFRRASAPRASRVAG